MRAEFLRVFTQPRPIADVAVTEQIAGLFYLANINNQNHEAQIDELFIC